MSQDPTAKPAGEAKDLFDFMPDRPEASDVERPEADLGLQRPTSVSFRLAQLDEGIEVRPRVVHLRARHRLDIGSGDVRQRLEACGSWAF